MKKIITLFLCFVCAYLIQNDVFASTTGKISGIITDTETNQPLAGTNIIIDGTLMGASSDIDGFYFILNVPPGVYTLKISQIGYKEVEIKDITVSADMTTTQNVSLIPRILETDEVVVIEAERPLVNPDRTSSLESVTAEEIEALPVRDINDVLALQAGIIRGSGTIYIRGGRSSEVAYWVDGISTTDVYNGTRGLTVENSAIDELQVISGTFNAEYGDAMSGIINMVTKEGGSEYSARLEGYVGDYITGHDVYNVLKDFYPDTINGVVTAVGDEENPLKKFNPIYNGEFTLSGPVPLLGSNLSFFSNTRYFEREGYLYGRELYTPYGTPGDSSLVSMNPEQRLSTQQKLTLKLGSNIKFNYNVFYNTFKNDKIFGPPYRTQHLIDIGAWNYQGYKYNTGGIPQQEGYSLTHIFTLNHAISANTYYELRFNHHYNEYKRYVYKNPTATPNYLVQILDNDVEVDRFDPKEEGGEERLAYYDSVVYANEDYSKVYIPDPDGPQGYMNVTDIYAPTGNSFHNDGMDMDHESRSTNYWTIKFDLASQLNKSHLLKAGLEFKRYELDVDIYKIVQKTKNLTEEEQTAGYFVPAVPGIESLSRNKYTRKPLTFSAYTQDKIEISNNIIINAGLRFDYFDSKGVIPADPRDPDIYNPTLVKNRYKDAPASLANNNFVTDYDLLYTQYTPDERSKFMYKDADAKMQLSPRIGIAYPISSKGVIHFSYGHFFQIPEFQYLYYRTGFKTGLGTGDYLFGNADLEPQKTVMYEIGLQQELTQNIGIDVTLFYRDIRGWVGSSTTFIRGYLESKKFYFYENKDYSNVRGITLKLEKRHSNDFSTRIDYTFQIAEGTYSNPIDAYNSIQGNDEPRRALIPLNWDQRHTLNGSLIYSRSDWTVSLIGSYWTGTPYTPTFPYDQASSDVALKAWRTNSSTKPSQKRVDLYINKRLSFGEMYCDLFCNIYNLFDIENATQVYGDTGSPDHNTFLDPGRVTYSASRVGTIDDFERQPSWYGSPREVQLGVAIGF